MFRALNHRNYRLFFYGQSISLVGTWMERTALSWLVYRLTDSALLLGVVGFSGQIATVVLAPFAGVIADRHHRHRLLLITQVVAMGQAFIIAFLVLTGSIQVWQIIALSIGLGFINAFDIPVRQSFTSEMIDNPDDLGNAIALNSSVVNGARLIGPSIAGFLIATVGEGICFLLNAFSFLGVIISLLKMRVPKRKLESRSKTKVWHELKEGFHYTFGSFPIRTILLLLSFVSLIAGGVQILMPVFARDIFHGGAKMLGLLMGSTGLGSLFGAMYLARRKNSLGLGKVIVTACCLFGVGMIGFVVSPSLWFSLVMLVLCGFGMIVQMASCNIVLQNMVEENKRGRVMSFYLMSFMGMASFGSLLGGSLAHHMRVTPLFIIGGICLILVGGLFALQLPRLRELVRPIYIKKGIITEIIP
ncbi:MAG: MFS transporter [Candidatus Omnitrophica bacterium]|nr:MFS transporter [Candidatus Omnitrophota bacterium]